MRGEPLHAAGAHVDDALGQEFDRWKSSRARAAHHPRDINPTCSPSFPTTPSRWRSPRRFCSSTSSCCASGDSVAAARRALAFLPVVSFTCPQLLAASAGAQSLGPKL